MRIVVDTNVLVSALLHAGRVPDRLLRLLWERQDVVLYDARIVAEFRSVVARPKFASVPIERREELLDRMLCHGADLGRVPAWSGVMNDEDDRVFVEVALAGRADGLVTGNARHYPKELGFEVLGPTALLQKLEGTGSNVTAPRRSDG